MQCKQCTNQQQGGERGVGSWSGYVWSAFPHVFVFGMVDCPVRDILGCSLNQ